MNHPEAVVEKARRFEQVLFRVKQGEPLEELCQELDVRIDEKRLARLQQKYEEGGGSLEALIDGRYGHGVKVNSAMREWLYERKRQDASLTAPQLAEAFRQEFGVSLTDGHLNYLLRKVGLTRAPGRPFKVPERAGGEETELTEGPIEEPESREPEQENVQATDNVGLFFPGGGQRSDGDNGNGGNRCGGGVPDL
jgi:transposase